MNMGLGGGSGSGGEAQRLANEIRDNPGIATRWDRRQWIWFGLACIPLIVCVVIGLIYG